MRNNRMIAHHNGVVLASRTTALAWLGVLVTLAALLWTTLLVAPGPGPVPDSDWPQVTRTVDGVPTVVMPEDLDRQ